jgi:hypothetical protein
MCLWYILWYVTMSRLDSDMNSYFSLLRCASSMFSVCYYILLFIYLWLLYSYLIYSMEAVYFVVVQADS